MKRDNEADMPLLNKIYTKIGEPLITPNRMMDRQGPFRRSNGNYNITRIGGDWKSLYVSDPFHTMINTRTSRIIFGVFFLYFLVILAFAVAYRFVHRDCNLQVDTFMQAWFFSLETIMTIGYSTRDIFFNSCTSMFFLLTLESFAGIFLDSICIGIFYARFSRAQGRASTIVFTQNAIIRKIRGHYYFMFQVCERRKHQLVEAHVRCYAIRNELTSNGEEFVLFQTHQMRLQQPDDSLGGYLLMVFPQLIVHRIDEWSPLFPPECMPEDHDPSTSYHFPEPCQRKIDSDQGNREENKTKTSNSPTQAQIEKHLMNSEVEILVLLEGIDGPTSSTMQARYSYKWYDIKWHQAFRPCVSKNNNGGAIIDFDKFQELVDVDIEKKEFPTPSKF